MFAENALHPIGKGKSHVVWAKKKQIFYSYFTALTLTLTFTLACIDKDWSQLGPYNLLRFAVALYYLLNKNNHWIKVT